MTFQKSSFGKFGAKRRAISRGVFVRVRTFPRARPRATSDRRRKRSFGGTRQYFCHGVRRVDVEVEAAKLENLDIINGYPQRRSVILTAIRPRAKDVLFPL